MSCYSAVYAVYNIFYSIGMLASAALASGAAHLLGFWGVLLCASSILLLSIPLLATADRSGAVDYLDEPLANRGVGKILLCCSVLRKTRDADQIGEGSDVILEL